MRKEYRYTGCTQMLRLSTLRMMSAVLLVVLCISGAYAQLPTVRPHKAQGPDIMPAIAPASYAVSMKAAPDSSIFTHLYNKDKTRVPDFVRVVGEDFTQVDLILPDSVFFENSERAIFVVNKWDLDLASPLVKRIESEVVPLARREGWVLVGVSVRGAASPEGPLRWNITLSERRAKALTDYLRKHFMIDAMSDSTDLLAVSTTAEDYPFLHRMMRQDGDADTELVGATILRHNGDMKKIKADLMKVDGGRMWKRLLKQYYPRLRAARVMLFFRRQEVSLKPVVVPPPTSEIRMERPEPILIQAAYRRQHMLAVRTNLLYDFFYHPSYGFAPSPDIQLEFYPKHGPWTLVAGLVTPYWQRWDKYKFWQFRHYTLGMRYYFKPEDKNRSVLTHTGWFVGGGIMANKYGIGFSKTRGWEGEGIGAEATGGYVLPLSRDSRWRLEFVLGLGTYWTKYDPYVFGNPKNGKEDGKYYYDYKGKSSAFKRRNHSQWWFGPTQVGINLTYDLLFWKKQKNAE